MLQIPQLISTITIGRAEMGKGFFFCILLWFGSQIQFLKWNKGNPLELQVKLYFGDRKCYLDTRYTCIDYQANRSCSAIDLSEIFFQVSFLYQPSFSTNIHRKRLAAIRVRSCDSSTFIRCTPISIWSFSKESEIWSI